MTSGTAPQREAGRERVRDRQLVTAAAFAATLRGVDSRFREADGDVHEPST